MQVIHRFYDLIAVVGVKGELETGGLGAAGDLDKLVEPPVLLTEEQRCLSEAPNDLVVGNLEKVLIIGTGFSCNQNQIILSSRILASMEGLAEME